MYYGCSWYPEHWDESTWAANLRLMKQAGMNVVRVAEFAWSRLEPSEGQYTFEWLEKAIALAGEHGIVTVIGTPSGSAPAWMTQKYPEVLAVRESGHPERHGGRGHHSPASPKYRDFCRKMAEALARRFGKNPNVIGWQIDNEYWPYSYDPHTLGRFQQWLKQRYGTLANLNAAWSNAYWSQDYSEWSQIPAWFGWQNPSLLQMGKVFMSQIVAEFQQVQMDAIRANADKRQWITHNFHAHKNLDFAQIARPLDFVSWDPYVGQGHLDPAAMGSVLDFARGIARKNFWIMETQPATVNWARVNNALDRGEVRRIVWHKIGHGAEAVLYWQWQNALGGQEQYHGSLVGPGGDPRPFYQEAVQIGQELAKAGPVLEGTSVKASVAILDSYPDRWAIEGQMHHEGFDVAGHLSSFYRPLRESGLEVDILQPTTDLSGYALVIAPHLHILTGPRLAALRKYVQAGGHLVLGPRSGVKDENNALLPSRPPGKELGELLGAWVEEYYALEKPVAVSGLIGEGVASIWGEYLSAAAADVQVLLRYGPANGWLDGQPAAVTRAAGKGRITYMGAWADGKLMDGLTRWACGVSGVSVSPLPAGVQCCRRVGAGREVLIVLNHASVEQSVALSGAYHDVLAERSRAGTVTIGAGEVMVLSRAM